MSGKLAGTGLADDRLGMKESVRHPIHLLTLLVRLAQPETWLEEPGWLTEWETGDMAAACLPLIVLPLQVAVRPCARFQIHSRQCHGRTAVVAVVAVVAVDWPGTKGSAAVPASVFVLDTLCAEERRRIPWRETGYEKWARIS